LNPYQRCLWLVDELTWRFHVFLLDHPSVKRSSVLNVPLDEAAKMAKGDGLAVAAVTAHLRTLARKSAHGGPIAEQHVGDTGGGESKRKGGRDWGALDPCAFVVLLLPCFSSYLLRPPCSECGWCAEPIPRVWRQR
jgi:hypothetical protein